MPNYRTMSIRIKRGHKLYSYFKDISLKVNNLYNTTNFFVRQVFSGISKKQDDRQPNETYVIDTINAAISGKFSPISPENSSVNYYALDHVFKVTSNKDYYALPSHTNQHIMKEVFEAWKSFFNSIKDYSKHPEKYTGRPNLPRYAKKGGYKTITFTNQTCIIKDDKYLKFPKTKQTLNIGKLGMVGKLKEVKVIPSVAFFTVQVVFDIGEQPVVKLNESNVIGIDLGVNNFAAITNNKGLQPFIINGKGIKSTNQYYNKMRAHYYGILRRGMAQKEGLFYSRRLNRLNTKRNDRMKDFMHKASKKVIEYCIKNDIGTIVIGKNAGFKENVKLRKKDKQAFIAIPYTLFIQYISYKAEFYGIKVIITEESYTSKASFVDRDKMPVYRMEDIDSCIFNGKREERGLYRTGNGIFINADCNGSGNIIRKVFPDAFHGRGDRGVVGTPKVLSIA